MPLLLKKYLPLYFLFLFADAFFTEKTYISGVITEF